MIMYKISHNITLDDYILNYELAKLAGISSNAYRFWKSVEAVKYDGSRVVYLKKNSLPHKYERYICSCTNLNGYIQSQAFCKYTGLASSHLTKSNKSGIYEIFDIIKIGTVKLINLKKFYDDFGLNYNYHIYIEKCKYFGPFPLEKKIKLSEGMCLGYY